MIYNPQGLVEKKNKINYRPSREKVGSDVVFGFRKSNKNTLYSKYENYPKSIIKINSEHNVSAFHPTQKPVALMEYLIKTYTLENELALDFTAGSGTTAIACINTGRKFILIEKEKEYCDIIIKRLEQHLSQSTLLDFIKE